MSAFGTKRTSLHVEPMSAFGRKADIAATPLRRIVFIGESVGIAGLLY